ncbi:hypothetical protein [Desulfosporosinus sp. I2]|uniref:hypothetical protein n=1 Tax=Desulfosporosinus sp. I2 TaxID=1617025 RepID=UPI0012E009D3|nr:hypothetical protein [Desulfosporosinus sp. I2]
MAGLSWPHSATEELQTAIKRLSDQIIDPFQLLDQEEAPILGKYDEFLPPELLRKARKLSIFLTLYNYI